MTYQRPINAPSIDFAPPAYADKVLLRLEDMRPFCIPGFRPMPDEVEIIGFSVAQQSAYDYPAGCFGNLWVSVAGPNYIKMAGCPTAEKCSPFEFVPLGSLRFRPGADPECTRAFSTSILYRKGVNRIFYGCEVLGATGFGFHLFSTIMTSGNCGEWPLEDGVAWAMPMDAWDGGGTLYMRNLIPAIPCGGSQVEVDFMVGASGGTIINASVGIQASGFNMTAEPVPLLFNGQAGVTLPAYGRARAVASQATTAGASLLVSVKASGSWAYRKDAALPAKCWYAAESSMAGATEIDRIYSVDLVRVLA